MAAGASTTAASPSRRPLREVTLLIGPPCMHERKVGGRFHLKLSIGSRPIANKYHEGKGEKDFETRVKSA